MSLRLGSAMALKTSEVVAALGIGSLIFPYKNMSSHADRGGETPAPPVPGPTWIGLGEPAKGRWQPIRWCHLAVGRYSDRSVNHA